MTIDPFVAHSTQAVAEKLKTLEDKARQNKLRFFLILSVAMAYGLMEMIGHFHKTDYSNTVITLTCVLFASAFAIPPLFTPLNYFLPHSQIVKMNADLKSQLVMRELEAFPSRLRFYPSASLDEDLIFNLGLIRRSFRAAYGDDYLKGTFKGYPIRMSEYHISSFVVRHFDGFLIIVNDSPFEERFVYADERFGRYLKRSARIHTQAVPEDFVAAPEIAFANNVRSRLYLGITGNKNMLEYSFKKIHINAEKLSADILAFRHTLAVLDAVTG